MGVAAGFANYYLRITELIIGIGLGLLFYMISVVIVHYVLRYGEAELKGKNRYMTMGGGTFIVEWIMVAVLLNTVSSS